MILDTRSIAPSDRFQFWCDFISRRLLVTTLHSANKPDYIGQIEIHGLDDGYLVFVRGDSCGSVRGRKEIALSPRDAPRWLLMRMNVSARVEHCGRKSCMQAGDLILIDTRRPYEREDAPLDCTILAMSDGPLRDWDAVFENCAGHRFSAMQGWGRLLSAHLAGLSPELLLSIGKHGTMTAIFTKNLVYMLLQMALQESQNMAGEKPASVRSEQARESLYNLMLLWIREHHDDPLITAEQLAQSFGVSLRYVHKLFAAHSQGRGFLAYLQRTRLEHAAQLLSNVREAGSSISDISWRCGFSDVSTFGRLFKRHYNMTPGSYRGIQLKAGDGSSGLR